MNGLQSVGPSVLVSGEAARILLEALVIAARSRTQSGLPLTSAHRAIAQALADVLTADGHADVRAGAAVEHVIQQQPTVPVDEAAQWLGKSPRQIRRLAPRLGGRRIAGRWFLDADAIRQHKEGTRWTENRSSAISAR